MHQFIGKWITDEEFYQLAPRNVFHKQLQPVELPCTDHLDRHILFRRRFHVTERVKTARVYISADDYYKLYINGRFVAQGPAPSYHFQYNYNVIDVTDFLQEGENTVAVHSLYQGLINRVWQSGDLRHGMILDLELNGAVILASDESFKTAPHTAYRAEGTVGYKTQFMESYDAAAPEVGFERPDFDDADWSYAKLHQCDDHTLAPQQSAMLTFEEILPQKTEWKENRLTVDFGSNYVGYLCLSVKGRAGDIVTIRCGQELEEDGRVRYQLRANCCYEEPFILREGESVLDQFDYKSFRYAELILPEGCEVTGLSLMARHYPFRLKAKMKPIYEGNESLRRIFDLCTHTQEYGVQEVIQDCMEREKGFYVGDGCYTALTHLILTGDDGMVRKLIDDAFASAFVTDGLVTCLDCSFMQEIAEYPLMLVYLVEWHYRLVGDRAYLARQYPRIVRVLNSYRRDYEREGLLWDLDKWCVVEWPKNFQDDYGVDVKEGKICHEPHVSLNAYYVESVRAANRIAAVLGEVPYREEAPLVKSFLEAFYVKEKGLFKDGYFSDHVSYIGNVTAFGLGLCPDADCLANILNMIEARGIHEVSLFGAFLMLEGFVRYGREELIPVQMQDVGAWLRMLREDATTTFEGWGKDTKWNTSLFHLTMSYGAVFLSNTDLPALFGRAKI